MAVQIQIRRGIGTDWSNVDPTLADGEIGYDKTAKQLKIGDGSSTWTTLPYFSPSISGTIGVDTQITQLIVTGIATATTFVSTAATGTSPLTVTSTTLNSNFNADLLDGEHGTYYRNASNINSGTLNADRLPSDISITNLNVTGIGTLESLDVNALAEFLNLNVSGIATFGSSIELNGISGNITATNFYGSGENLTGVVTSIVAGTNVSISTSTGQVTINASGGGGGAGSGIGTPLSEDPANPLNLIYKTPSSTTIPPDTLTVVESDIASGNIAYTRLNSITVSTGSTFTVSTGTTFIMNVLDIF